MQNQNIAALSAASDASRIAQLEAMVARLEAEKAANQKPITFKVSEKGALSVYGLNARFPVTLYAGQWERLFDSIPKMTVFIRDNASKLARK